MPDSLPSGWTYAKLGDVAIERTERENDPGSSAYDRFVGSNHIGRFELTLTNWGSTDQVSSAMKVFHPGDYLFVRRSLYASDFRERAARAWFSGLCSGDILPLRERPGKIADGYLMAVLNQPSLWSFVVKHATGSITRRIKWKQLREYEFALPPVAEQQKVVELLQAASGLVKSLSNTQGALREARRAVLKELLFTHAQNESTNRYLVDELSPPGVKGALKTGPFGTKLRTSMFIKAGVPVIPIGAITDEGLDPGKFDHISPEDASTLSEYRVRAGDIVFSRVADVGRCHLVRQAEVGYIISSNLIRIRVDPGAVLPHYLWLLLRHSVAVREQIAGLATQAVGNGRWLVNTKTMALLRFPIPPVALQQAAISADFELSASCSVAQNRMEEAQALTSAILRDVYSPSSAG